MNYNYLYKNIGERIEELRKEKNLTQEKLAEKAGLHRAYFWDIENGRNISIKTIYKISQALGVTLSEFFGSFK
jgi:transcriptional regulator with XRE-family HTH domain